MVKTLKKIILHTKDDLDRPNFSGHESGFNQDNFSERRVDEDRFGENHFDDKRFGPSDDYHIPEPEDIRRMPTPGFQEPSSGFQNQNSQQNNFNYRRDQPMPMPERQPMPYPSQPAPAPQPSYPRNIEDTLNQILYRLDDIERRLDRIEGYSPRQPVPQPRRY